ncbi:MAG TPA: O-antigen ligase family protein [Candidatus Nanoarchaeia archaeon]
MKRKMALSERVLYFLFLLLIPASIIRVNASLPGYESFFLFRILLFLILALLFLTFLFKRKYILERLTNLKKEKFVVGFFIAWLLASAVSYFWIIDFEKYFRYNVLLVTNIFFGFTLIFFLQDRETLHRIWKLLLITFGAALFIALLEIFFGFRLPGSGLLGEQKRLQLFVSSFFHHPNDFASYISLSLPFLTLMPLNKTYEKYKWWIFISVLLAAFILTFTGSRINYVATIIGLLLAAWILKKEAVKQILAYLAILVVAFFSLIPASGPEIAVKTLKIFDQALNKKAYFSLTEGAELGSVMKELVGNSGSAAVRKNLMINSYQIVKEKPGSFFIGLGAGQVEKYMEQFGNTKDVANLHNWWLEVLVDHGIFIGFGYMILFLWLLREIYKKALKTKDNFLKYINYSLVVILIVFVLTSISPSSSVGYAPLWLTLGLALAAKNAG